MRFGRLSLPYARESGIQLRTNRRNKFIDLFVGTGRSPKTVGIGIKEIFVRAEFPKAKICQKNGPKFGRGRKKSFLNRSRSIPPKKLT